MSARRHILLSAFACSPRIGSECGVGWRWATELARRHDVTVVTHAFFRTHVEEALAAAPVAGLRFVYHELPGVQPPHEVQVNSRWYYWRWQRAVRPLVRQLLRERAADAVHHLTWGSYRLPCFLGGLGAPLVIGPVGGGEGAHERLYRSWPWRERLFYRVREASIALSRWDPFVLWTMAQAACVLAKTRETRAALPWFARERTALASEIGVAQVAEAPPRARAAGEPLQLLYAGRLLGGKGVPYVLRMMALLRAQGVPARLVMAGSGRLLAWAQAQVRRHGLEDVVTLPGMLPRNELAALYDTSDLLVFPSWHDSSGNVVTEALARGLPVLCLDQGGPSYAVDERCGICVPTAGCSEEEVARALADEVAALHVQRERLPALRAGALARAREMSWSAQVAQAYAIVEQRLGWAAGATP